VSGPAVCVMVTGSGPIKVSPGMLFAVVLTGAAAAQISVLDGGASGTELVGLRLGGAGSVVFAPCVPLSFSKLYVTFDAGNAEVSVVYV